MIEKNEDLGLDAYADEPPEDRMMRRLAQAEALARMMTAGTGERFRVMDETLQDDACWLLGDLIAEARSVHRQMRRRFSNCPSAGDGDLIA